MKKNVKVLLYSCMNRWNGAYILNLSSNEDAFDVADPIREQYDCHIWTQDMLSSQMGFFVSHSRATDCDIGKVFALNSQGDLIFFFFWHLWQMVEICLHIFLCKNVFVISYMALVYLVQW